MTRFRVWIATVGPVGYVPVAPGTAGSAVGIAIYFLMWRRPFLEQAIVTALITLLGVIASTEASRFFGKSDPSHVVIDEVAGQLVTLQWTGVGPLGAAIGFVLFRALDIVKPWPANRLESLHGGAGIMADDLMAGAYGCAILHGVLWLVPAMR
jgi:phosphatidylglycerophosphatase A